MPGRSEARVSPRPVERHASASHDRGFGSANVWSARDPSIIFEGKPIWDGITPRSGGRLPLLEPGNLQGSQKELYARMKDTLVGWADASGLKGMTDDGRMIGPFNPYLYSSGITPGFLAWMAADKSGTTLDKRVHEVVILSVGAVWQSPYELYAHSAVARTVGVPETAIQALVRGEPSDELTAAEQVASRFARQLAGERRVDDELYREAEAIFGRRGLVDMVYLVGMYLLTCALLNAFEIPAPN